MKSVDCRLDSAPFSGERGVAALGGVQRSRIPRDVRMLSPDSCGTYGTRVAD